MNYQETLNWLFAQLPMYQREGQAAYKANLDNTLQLDEYFRHPHKNFKTIHVAGTNGKGSVSHMLASILQQAGYKTGLYTSPHLKDFRERIKINGEMVSEQYVIDFVRHHADLFSRVKPFQHCPFAPLLISLSAHPYIDYYISTKISTRNFQFALFVFLRALFTSPRGAHPRRAFLCNRNKVSYYTKRLHTHVYTVPSAHDSIV